MGVDRPLLSRFILLAALVATGCLLSPQPDPPGLDDATGDHGGTGDTADAGRDGEPPPDDALSDTAPDASDGTDDGDWNRYDDECPTDPMDGRTGASCADDEDCGPGFECVLEYTAEDPAGTPWIDYAGGYCVPVSPPGVSCAADSGGRCPGGARCVEGFDGARCLDACSVASVDGELYGANCDCRSGYRCDMSREVCVPGCTADHECCATWIDADADGVRQVAELTPVADCVATCDRHTFECVYTGDPTAQVGDSCLHGAQCPAGASCWRTSAAEQAGLPGICLVERCELPGRTCPEGSACVTKDPGVGFDSFCARPCDTSLEPGSLESACGRDRACVPASFDAAVAGDGACLPRI